MAKAKKRLSKKAKAALKALEESKLKPTSNIVTGEKADPGFVPNTPSYRNAKAHKRRPNKKRGG